VLVCVSALALAACGSSGSSTSSSNTSATSSAPSTTTSGAPTGAGGAAGFDPHHVPRSAPIASSAYYSTWLRALTQQRLNATQSQFGAHCIQDGLTAAGFKTQGEAEGPKTHQAISIVLACLAQARKK
jgi:hypothetical protein